MTRPLDFFKFKQKELHCEMIALSSLAKEFGTPLYVYSERAFEEVLEKFKKNLSGLNTTFCFAVKSNSNLSVLRLLNALGAGMDLVSGGELYRVNKAGVPGNKIVFSGVGKTEEEMRAGLTYKGTGILSFHVESEPELSRLNQVAQSLGKLAPVTLRFNPDVNPKTHPYISTGLKKNKFGLSKYDVLQIIQNYKKYPAIRFKGLSIHIGSQLTSLSPIQESFLKTKHLIKELQPILSRDGQTLEWADLGGGLGIQYKDETPASIEAYCRLVKKIFGKEKSLRLLFEPGRIISGNAGVLLTRVLYRKEHTKKDFLIVDAAMNDLMRPSLYGSYHEIIPVLTSQNNSRKKAPFNIVGPICESSDSFASDRKLSVDLDSGDLLAILSAGAYGFTMASQYNSRPRAAEILVRKDGSAELIRSRETYEDLIRGETL